MTEAAADGESAIEPQPQALVMSKTSTWEIATLFREIQNIIARPSGIYLPAAHSARFSSAIL